MNRIGELPEKITVELMECAVQPNDISGQQATIIRAALDAYRNAAPG